MEKLRTIKNDIEKGVEELKFLFNRLESVSKMPYGVARDIRKTCQTLKIKAQELRKAATEAWKSSKTS